MLTKNTNATSSIPSTSASNDFEMVATDETSQSVCPLDREVSEEQSNNGITNDSSNKLSVYNNCLSFRTSNILLIGLSYNSYVLHQYLGDGGISSITQCKDSNGRFIDQCVARDTYRCFVLEAIYPKVKVFTVNKCTDTLRLCDNNSDPYNINSDVCTNQFRGLI